MVPTAYGDRGSTTAGRLRAGRGDGGGGRRGPCCSTGAACRRAYGGLEHRTVGLEHGRGLDASHRALLGERPLQGVEDRQDVVDLHVGDPERAGAVQITVDGETEPVAIRLGVWVSNTKSRRDKLTAEQLCGCR